MICPNCGHEVPEDKAFCGFCGTKLAKPTPEVEPMPEQKEEPRADAVSTPETRDKPAIKSGAEAAPTIESRGKPISVPEKKSPSVPKWLFWAVPAALIVTGIVLAFAFGWIPVNLQSAQPAELPTTVSDPVQPDAPPVNEEVNTSWGLAGIWVGEISNEESGWSATLELNLYENCEVGSICGTYRLYESTSHGELELVEKVDNGYRLLEQPIVEENVPGGGYETIRLIDDNTLQWSFEFGSPGSDTYITSTGLLTRQ